MHSETLEERLRRREREISAIGRITAALHAHTNLDDMERTALNVAIETVDASGGTIYLHDPKRHVLVFKYVVSPSQEITRQLLGLEMPDDKGLSGEVFHSGEAKITLKVSEESTHNRDVDARTQYRTESTITVPLKSMAGRTLGVMQVLNRRIGVFDQEDLSVLEILSAQAASALETAKLYEEARRASVINLIGDISHDVKNLLTPVVTGTQTLEMMMESMFEDLDPALETLTDEQKAAVNWAVGGVRDFYKEAMSMVYDGAQDAQDRVREIADAIKGIISEPHFEPSDFRERAESVAKVLKLVAERKGVAIDLSGIQDTGPVELDRKGMYNALYNLVNNAIPETPEGGLIVIRTRPIELKGEPGLEIEVADTGTGMPPHVRERMFSDHAVSTKPGGTGLGTRIVRNVVESHHGTICVDSEMGVGTTFTIRIPMCQPRVEAPAGGANGAQPGGNGSRA
ncbi:MAG TPA: GAF domain-containing sensor histidine kinase [Armatimonadota bacterium]|nr:GAF domain-containing sensor histidine kinase [Armatimonadota bacterium]